MSKLLLSVACFLEATFADCSAATCNFPLPYKGTSPTDADAHITKMSHFSQNHKMLDHKFLKRFRDGAFLDFKHAVRAFATEHYTYSRQFIKYLRAVVDKVDDEETKAPILENIKEESGNYEDEDLELLDSHGVKREWVDKKPHKDLIKHFLATIEVDLDAKDKRQTAEAPPGVRFTQYMLDVYAKSNACEGLAILGFAIEDTVSTMYEFIWAGLKKAEWLDPKDYVFFPLHILVDDGHADLLKAAYKRYLVKDSALCKNAPRLVAEVLSRRITFMDEILDIADAPPKSSLPFNDKDADAHIARMSQFSTQHEMLRHSFLRRFQDGLFLDFPHAVRTFGAEHYTYSRNFINYLQAVVSKVSDEATKAPILENIAEESGNYEAEDLAILASHGLEKEWVNKKPHKQLIRHFLAQINVNVDDIGKTDSPGRQFTNYMLDMYASSTACEGLAILGFAIEDTVSALYTFIWEGLKKSWLKPEDYVFFPLHILVDDGHADLLKAAYKRYLVSDDAEQCRHAPKKVEQVLARRIQFMDEILALADAPSRTSFSSDEADTHIAQMSAFSQNHHMLQHPFLSRFAHGLFLDVRHAVRAFGREHYTYSRKFIKYLRAVVDKVPDEATRAPILENIEEESGNYEEDDLVILESHGVKKDWVDKKPHKELIAHFLQKINVTFHDDPASPGIKFTNYMLNLYETSNACEGLAILGFAIEDTVSNLYDFIWAGLKKIDWLHPKDYVFFPLHILVDDGHADLLKAAYKKYLLSDAKQCARAPALVSAVLQRRIEFLDEILALADTPSTLPLPPAVADSHVATMSVFSQNHSLLSHPFLVRFRNAEFVDLRHAVRTFGREHYTYSRRFIQYLRAVVDKVPDNATRAPILENIAEESGNYEDDDLKTLDSNGVKKEWVDKKPHKDLILKFLNAIDVKVNEDDKASPGMRFTQYMLDLYQKSSACEGLAILGFAIEDTVSQLYEFIWEGLKKSWLTPEDYVFFPLHILVDDGHADLLKAAYKMYLTQSANTARQCTNAPAIVAQVLRRREQFLDEIRALADAPPLIAADGDGVTQQAAIDAARNRTRAAALTRPKYTMSQKIALSAQILYRAGHVNSLAGQVSCVEMLPNGGFGMHTLQYGLGFDEITPSNLIVVDKNLNTVGGKNLAAFPNYAIRFHLHVYVARPDARCIIHTHPPHLNALGLAGGQLTADHMDTIGLYEHVAYESEWPGVPFGDEEGSFIVKALGEHNYAAVLAHHGMIVIGRNIEEATYRAFFLEDQAKLTLKVMSATRHDIPRVDKKLAQQARAWRMSSGPVDAHFHYWARQVLQTHPTLLTE